MDFAVAQPSPAVAPPPVLAAAVMPRRHRITRADYARLETCGGPPRPRTELIAGEIIDRSPQGNRHGNAIARLTQILVTELGDRFAVRPQLPMALTDDTEPEPDFCVSPWPDELDSDHPSTALLVIEVAASSIDFDRQIKLGLYAAAGVAEYWIVDVTAKQVEVYTGPRGATYASKRTCGEGEVIACTAISDLAVPVAAIFSARPV